MNPTLRRSIPGIAALGLVWVAGLRAGTPPEEPEPSVVAPEAGSEPALEIPAMPVDPREAALRADVRVTAFLNAYGAMIDSVRYRADDLVFYVAGERIHFLDGRMLSEDNRHRWQRCDPLFYRYPLEMPSEPPPLPEGPVRYCSDVQEALWGATENEIRQHARGASYIDRRLFVNDVVAEALGRVERDILALAGENSAVAAWIDETETAYSFVDRGIAGTATRSQHAWGLAVDFVPGSYDGRQVYWRWTRAWNPRGWDRTPLEERWTPPAAVVEAFERHGFLWGGKWAHFDNIHFEYRPEILEYNRLLAAAQ